MMENKPIVIISKTKPIVSYYKSGDPTINYDWAKKLTDINIIKTKVITDKFIDVCIENKHRIFLHVVITGLGKTVFEPNIQSVKSMFSMLEKLVNLGFPQKQILWIVDPVLPNDNGLKSLKLLLRVFSEFRPLRLRYVRFSVLRYRQIDSEERGKIGSGVSNQKGYKIPGAPQGKNTYVINNWNIIKRPQIKTVMMYLTKTESFFREYYSLINSYKGIITVDNSEQELIGIRELLVFGYKNRWKDLNGQETRIVEYDNGNKFKPMVNIISVKSPTRCHKRCLLCEHRY